MVCQDVRSPFICLIILVSLLLAGCGDANWNSPYSEAENSENIYYSSFSSRPKHLDPAQSYSSNEIVFTGQIYEPPLQYHFLKRPYTLVPLSATEVPQPYFEDKNGNRLANGVSRDQIAYSVYEIHIQPGIQYQPHPAFAKDASGKSLYLDLSPEDLVDRNELSDFSETGTRELVAADYVYEIKRLAHPKLHSPIFGLMTEYIVGLKEYSRTLREVVKQQEAEGNPKQFLDLQQYPMSGVEVVDRYTYRIKLYGEYPQFVYWLAMPFFGPIPPEADQFYSQSGMKEKNITLDWYPVGTGPYMLTVNNPNRQMVLERNPNFHGERYPNQGEDSDKAAGFLTDAGKALPFIDRVVFSLEKEDIPVWNKFLQGYYDASGISSDSFDQAIQVSNQGEAGLTDDMRDKGIRLSTSVEASIFYMGFNMRDSVVGGYTEQARKLRQAISIAVDYEEFISIFLNDRGIPAQSPLPPGIYGYQSGEAGVNPYVYEWRNGKLKRKDIAVAKKLLAEAGYPDGRDFPTIRCLAPTPVDAIKEYLLAQWRNILGVEIEWESTKWTEYLERVHSGEIPDMCWYGWGADYPDPDCFLSESLTMWIEKWQNKDYDNLVERARVVTAQEERMKLYKQADKIVIEEAAVMPLNYIKWHIFVKPWVSKCPTCAIYIFRWKDVIIEPN